CSGPGLGIGGMPCGAPAGAAGLSWARASPARPRTRVQATTIVARFFMADLLAWILDCGQDRRGDASAPGNVPTRPVPARGFNRLIPRAFLNIVRPRHSTEVT